MSDYSRHQMSKDQIYFETLACALDAAYLRAANQGADFDSQEFDAFLSKWNGGVNYGETVTHSCPVFRWKGKIFNHSPRAMTVVIYRMESGRYELTTYVN